MSAPTTSITMGSAPSPEHHGKPKTSSMATASLTIGIVGILIFGIILGPLAIILGAIAIKRINEKPLELEGRAIAKAGIICGIIGIVVSIILIVVLANN